MRARKSAIDRLIVPALFSGASDARLCSIGSSTFTLTRSAYSPASASRRESASGMVFKWM
jgi:hypothetical protein